MFPASYFAPHYFAPVYFSDVGAVGPRYFYHPYFAQTYFPNRYFPGNIEVPSPEGPRYFYHPYFAARYFTNSYFPGNLYSVLVPPVPVVEVGQIGGGPAREPLVVIYATADLVLPSPILRATGRLTPAAVRASATFAPVLDLGLVWDLTSDPVPIGVASLLALPDVLLAGEVGRRPAMKTSRRTEEEDDLLAHYLALLGRS